MLITPDFLEQLNGNASNILHVRHTSKVKEYLRSTHDILSPPCVVNVKESKWFLPDFYACE